ncbi:hypothetical protein J132_03467 [Termitomyces sp. J132]|nr:hypothetical protein J132_03467 [Termitomyces sp. J132]
MLFECRHYQFERHCYLRQKLHCKAESFSHLLTKPNALEPLFRFISSMNRFKPQSNLTPPTLTAWLT